MIKFQPFQLTQYTHCYVVTDSTLSAIYNIVGDNVFVLPCGEQAKDFSWVIQLCSWLLKKHATRADTLVAVGGGSVGDVVGLVASIYKRGINFVNVPTTLLAMVDSSIGGKTAIDLDGVKNAVGSFVQGDTIIDCNFLKTLNEQQLQSGLGEIKKYCLLNKSIFDTYCQSGLNTQIIKQCVDFKQSIVAQDLYDHGIRHILNVGHTVAHAVELEYNLPHGIAVEYGLYYELKLSHKLGLATNNYVNRMNDKLQLCDRQLDIAKCIAQMSNDKKNSGQDIVFCLPIDNFCTKQISIKTDKLLELLC